MDHTVVAVFATIAAEAMCPIVFQQVTAVATSFVYCTWGNTVRKAHEQNNCCFARQSVGMHVGVHVADSLNTHMS